MQDESSSLFSIVGILGVIVLLFAACGDDKSLTGPARPSPRATDEPQARSGEFTSEQYDYSMRLPARDWTTVSATEFLAPGVLPHAGYPGADTFSGPGGGMTGADHPAIVVGAQPDLSMTLAEWTKVAIGEVRPDGCRPDSRKSIMVGGEPANLVEYHVCFRSHVLGVMLLHDNWAFHILWLSPRGSEAADERAFARVLKTFAFRS